MTNKIPNQIIIVPRLSLELAYTAHGRVLLVALFPLQQLRLNFCQAELQAHTGYSFAERENFPCSGYTEVLSVAGFKNRKCAM
jgi:hypothetical protein